MTTTNFKFEIETYKYAGTMATGYHDEIWGICIADPAKIEKGEAEKGEAVIFYAQNSFEYAYKKQADGTKTAYSSWDFAWTIANSTKRPKLRTMGEAKFETFENQIKEIKNLLYAKPVREFLKGRGWTYDGSGGWHNPNYCAD